MAAITKEGSLHIFDVAYLSSQLSEFAAAIKLLKGYDDVQEESKANPPSPLSTGIQKDTSQIEKNNEISYQAEDLA